MDEKLLAERLAKGDTDALRQIIRQYTGYVCTVAHNYSRGAFSNEEIDEIAADVFCKLWNCRENINADIGLRSYLTAAVRNLIKNRFKKKTLPTEDISELELSSGFLVEEAAELNDMISCMYEGLKELPKDEQEIFLRFYFYGERSSRIAAEMSTDNGTIGVKLQRIRKKLKKYLNKRGYYHV